jgi:hypothetical protein
LVEQYTFNVWALGSSPSGITKHKKTSGFQRFFYGVTLKKIRGEHPDFNRRRIPESHGKPKLVNLLCPKLFS